MAPADAEHGFAFIAFDRSVYAVAVLVTHIGAEVRIDRWFLTRSGAVLDPSIFSVHRSCSAQTASPHCLVDASFAAFEHRLPTAPPQKIRG